MKTEIRRQERQPEHRYLQAHDPARVEQFIESRRAVFRATEGFGTHREAEWFLETANDRFGRHPEGHERQPGQFDEREINESERRGQAEGHWLGERQTVMARDCAHHPAFAVGRLLVSETGLRFHFSRATSVAGFLGTYLALAENGEGYKSETPEERNSMIEAVLVFCYCKNLYKYEILKDAIRNHSECA